MEQATPQSSAESAPQPARRGEPVAVPLDNRQFLVGLGRAFAGALIFTLPMLMTMEMWWLGFYMQPLRIALLLVLTLPILVALSRFGGFRRTADLAGDVADALVAIVVAAVAAAATLSIFGVVGPQMSLSEAIGKLVLQIPSGALGAMLARSQLGGQSQDRSEEPVSYAGELFLMGVGALFLSFNVAPTEEMVLIAYKMTVWQELTLLAATLLLMHALVYAVNFRGGTPDAHMAGALLKFTIPGYAIVLLVSLTVLWLFGRLDGLSTEEGLSAGIVLAFPGGVGAALARLIL
ncbi:MAG: TIGR02587 family membrane protein [Phenylobacterium sp.]|uniref:TIGR02587 family membrane protein n=1 Tax=Phenylobacterium sp. TaxID=1871053 RepID=UPI0017C2C653|nr:TIGR02587 family membrane protein [Phenylobacterium sp.]MBA4794580.1 TIGR02587 family membrane protein [Phenylobacterium sp.]MBC7168089.1 TIGR02587 family membrane protein [Phenylobacterium sp.]